MNPKKKKSFPKVQESFRKFLTDESGKITKQDALGLSAGMAIIGTVDQATANHTSVITPSFPFPVSDPGGGHDNGPLEMEFVQITSSTCDHASGIVNGHYSSIPSVNITEQVYDVSSHRSHGSHGSHGSHCSWMC